MKLSGGRICSPRCEARDVLGLRMVGSRQLLHDGIVVVRDATVHDSVAVAIALDDDVRGAEVGGDRVARRSRG